MHTRLIRFTTSVLAATAMHSALAATTYTLVDLGPGSAKDLNSTGLVVGNSAAGGWIFNGIARSPITVSARYFGAPPEQVFNMPAISANAINDAGAIGGSVLFPGPGAGTVTPYVYTPGSIGTYLGLGTTTGINASGTAVGGSSGHAFVLTGGVLTTPAGPNPTPFAVNAAGVVVGSITQNPIETPVRFDGASFSVLDLSGLSLPDPGPGGAYSGEALSVNDAGLIVGKVNQVSGSPFPKSGYAFLYANGAATSLGSLGGIAAAANDINNTGTVVGTANLADGTQHAFVYTGNTMSDLNSLLAGGGAGWVLTFANAVNDQGSIVGEGTVGGETHAFLLTPATTGLAPTIAFQPTGTTVFEGEPFALQVTASGTPTLSYQWQHAGTNIPTATDRIYSVAHAGAADAGGYKVVVTNGSGHATSDEVSVGVSVLAKLDIATYAGLLVSGPVGHSFRIEAVERVGDTDWQALDTVTLDVSPTFWLDRTTPLRLSRIYRAVPVP